MRYILIVLVAVAACSAVALAQQPPPAAETSPAPDAGAPAVAGGPPVTGILDELETAPGGYSYNPQGRRDPFVSLLRPVSADRGPKTRKPGMDGFLIQEVALRGIVRTGGGGTDVGSRPGFIAVFQGPDSKSYFVREGQRLYDGVVLAVSAAGVTFRQDVTDPLSPVKTRELKKSLDASEEARP